MQQLELLCQSEGLGKHTGGKYLSIAQTTVAWAVVGPKMSQQSSASMDQLPQQTHVAQQIWRDKLRIQGFQHLFQDLLYMYPLDPLLFQDLLYMYYGVSAWVQPFHANPSLG